MTHPDPAVSHSKSAESAVPANAVRRASDWSEHEHVSDQVQLEAETFVQKAGSPELAKHAIDVLEQSQRDPNSNAVDSAQSATVDRNDAFLKALTDFETSIATPVVSGELTEWVTDALRACETLGAILHDHLQRLHAELFARILRQDLDLSAQVEKLKATDNQLAFVDWNNVTTSLEQLLALARSAKQDESKLATLTADVTKLAFEFVIAARTQETVIATWFSEAFNRDLGTSG